MGTFSHYRTMTEIGRYWGLLAWYGRFQHRYSTAYLAVWLWGAQEALQLHPRDSGLNCFTRVAKIGILRRSGHLHLELLHTIIFRAVTPRWGRYTRNVNRFLIVDVGCRPRKICCKSYCY